MAAARQIYYLSAVLPWVVYLAGLVYGDRIVALNPAFAGLALVVPIYLSFAIAVMGGMLIFASKRGKQPILGPVAATAVAGAICLWYLGKVLVLLLLRPALVALGLA